MQLKSVSTFPQPQLTFSFQSEPNEPDSALSDTDSGFGSWRSLSPSPLPNNPPPH